MQCGLVMQSVPKIYLISPVVFQPALGFPIRLVFRYPSHFNSHVRMQMRKVKHKENKII